MGSGNRDARRVDNAAKGIEAAARGDQINEKQIDNILNASHILDDLQLTDQLATRLEKSNGQTEAVLPKLAFSFSDANAKQINDSKGNIDKGLLEEFARSDRISPTHKLVATALLKRWEQIDTDNIAGISPKELEAWAAQHGVHRSAIAMPDVRVSTSGGRVSVPGGPEVRVGRRSGEVTVGGVDIQINGRGGIKVRRGR